MANKNLSVALELTANSAGLDAGLRRGQTAVHRFGQGVRNEFKAIDDAWNSTAANLGKIGLGLGGGAYLGAATKRFADAEHTLRGMGNAGDLTNRQLGSVQRELLQTAKDTNQFRESLIGGLNTLVSSGMEFDRSKSLIREIGYAATASQADIEDLSKTVFALDTNLKVLPKDMGKALNVLTVSGFSGAFELKDMARYFPLLTAQAGKLSMEGPTGAASLGAGLQVAKMGAGTQGDAATNLVNYLTKLTMKQTTENFAKEFNVDWEAKFKEFGKSADPLLASVKFIKDTVGTDPFKIQKIFGDQQVLDFLTPMLQHTKEYENIQAKSLSETGAIDKAYATNMGTLVEQSKRFRINMEAITEQSKSLNAAWSVGGNLLKGVNDKLATGDISLEGMVGGGAALAGGAYVGSRLLKGAAGGLFGMLGGAASGLAIAKATGATPVSVVNWPAGGEMDLTSQIVRNPMGSAAAGVGLGAAGSAASGALAGSGLRAAGSASLLGSAGALALSGAAGYGIGAFGINPLLTDYAKNRIGEAMADAFSPFSGEARQSINRTSRYQSRAGGDDAGSHDWTTPGTHAFMADTLGFGAAKMLSLFGNKEAKNAVAINENKEVQRRLANIGPDVDKALRDNNASLGDKLENAIREALAKASEKKVDMSLTLKGQPAILEKLSTQGANVSIDSGILGTGH
jgi:hypothetical protein